MILAEVDRLLEVASELGESARVSRLRGVRDDLAHAAVSLSYARHVLSVDLGILHRAKERPGDLQALVDDLPRLLAETSIGGGWSLSSDSLATMASADMALLGEADGLLTAHAAMARSDLGSPGEIDKAIASIDRQLTQVSDRRDRVEERLRDVRSLIVEQYQNGSAQVDDWLA